jgi:hypothetical protein
VRAPAGATLPNPTKLDRHLRRWIMRELSGWLQLTVIALLDDGTVERKGLPMQDRGRREHHTTLLGVLVGRRGASAAGRVARTPPVRCDAASDSRRSWATDGRAT